MILPDLEPNKKKYNAMESVLQEIQKAIQLPDAEIREHNATVREVLDIIIAELKLVDPLFKNIFSKILYGGSYYDGLKLNSPDEYDIDLALRLPSKELDPRLEICDISGFVKIRVDLDKFKDRPKYPEYRSMEKFVDDSKYLLTEKFRDWFEGILIRARNNLEKKGSRYKFSFVKSGPAFTLKLHIQNKLVCIDLVPSIIFEREKWPGSPFKKNDTRQGEFLVVPKTPHPNASRYNTAWRLSFQEQEKEILNGKNRLKDTIRLLKLLRNVQVQENSLPSYYIKTVMMLMAETVDDNFWSTNSRSYIFMMALRYFGKLLERRELPYYWNRNYNFFSAKKEITLENWSKRIDRIYKTLEKKLNCPSLRSELLKFFGQNHLLIGESQQNTQNGFNQLQRGPEPMLKDNEKKTDVRSIDVVNFNDSGIECGDNIIAAEVVHEVNITTGKESGVLLHTSVREMKDQTSPERQSNSWRDCIVNEVFEVPVSEKLEKMDSTRANVTSGKKSGDLFCTCVPKIKDRTSLERQFNSWRDCTENEGFGGNVLEKLEKMDPTQANVTTGKKSGDLLHTSVCEIKDQTSLGRQFNSWRDCTENEVVGENVLAKLEKMNLTQANVTTGKKSGDLLHTSVSEIKDQTSLERQFNPWRDCTEYEVFGVNVMKKLEKMDATQAIYAQKLIFDVLGQGLLKQLTATTDINSNKTMNVTDHCSTESNSEYAHETITDASGRDFTKQLNGTNDSNASSCSVS